MKKPSRGGIGWKEPSHSTQLDHHLIQALQLDGRAPFRRIADVLDVSENTVARRYVACGRGPAHRGPDRARAGRRVQLAAADPIDAGLDRAARAGDRQAPRPATCPSTLRHRDHYGITTSDGEESGPPILASLHRTSHVIGDQRALPAAHYAGDPPTWYTKRNPLTPEQRSTLVPDPPVLRLDDEPAVLDDVDRAVLACLSGDARATLPKSRPPPTSRPRPPSAGWTSCARTGSCRSVPISPHGESGTD